jgi:NADPH:quinone reductase-like Zn-dependent oxidoreductase
MKAAQYNEYGGPEVIIVHDNAEKPVLKAGQVLVEVIAASLNPIDWKVRAGFMKDYVPVEFPVTIGGNFSGIVQEVSPEVSQFKIGDEVYGQSLVLNGGSGSLAQLTASNADNTAHKPKSVDHVHAAALPLVGVSAVQALEQHIKLKKDQKILIHGGAGGIGMIAIQLAKHIGAYVTTTVSTDAVDMAKKLGADEVIDYKAQQFENLLHDFDAVFDTVGGEVTDKSFAVLKEGGILVSMAGQPSEILAKEKNITAISQNTNTNTDNLTRLAELVDQKIILVEIDKVFTLDQAKEAFEYFETGHPRGKVVIKIKE